MRTIFLSLLFFNLLSATWCYGQRVENYNEFKEVAEKWYRGKLTLYDSTTLVGLIRYNYLEGIVSYQAPDSTGRTFSAKNILGFEFYDNDQQRRRLFHTMPYLDRRTGSSNPAIFEVLKEFEHFAVLSFIPKMKIFRQAYAGPIPSPVLTVNLIQTNEVIFIIDKAGQMQRYVDVNSGKIVIARWGKLKREPKNQRIEGGILKNYVGRAYPYLQQFAKKNHLRFGNKKDLIEILDYYAALKVN